MKLNQLRDVLAVAESGSLRAAGRRLDIPQPLITRSIRELERELGAALFERHARGVRLTEIGAAFVRRAAIVETELQRARDEVEQLKGRGTGQVSIALSAASVIAILPATLQRFHRRYPDALLKVTEGLFQTVVDELLNGRTDFYVGPFDRSNLSPELSAEKLFDNRRLIVARRGHPLSHAKTIAELAQARWIRPAASPQASEADFEAYLREMGIERPHIVMHTRSALATLIAVSTTDFLSILPLQWLEFGPTSQGLASFERIEPFAAAPVCIVRRSDLPLTPLAEHLSDLVRRAGEIYSRRLDARMT